MEIHPNVYMSQFYAISHCQPASFPVCPHKIFVIVTATQPIPLSGRVRCHETAMKPNEVA